MPAVYNPSKSPVKNVIDLLTSKVKIPLSSIFEALVAQILVYFSDRLDVIETASVSRLAVTTYTADGAIGLTAGVHVIAKTSAAAMTIAAPSGIDGAELIITSNTNFAHVITFTGATLLDGTTGANTTVTMTAFRGSSIRVVAVGSVWLHEGSSIVTSIA